MSNQVRYTDDVGTKFYPDGKVRAFPGNTTVAMVPPECAAYDCGIWIQQELAAQAYGQKYAMLPPESFHMTTMELLCNDIRVPERWSRFLPLDATLEETDRFFHKQMNQVTPPQHLTMRYDSISIWRGILVILRPADDATASALQTYREQIAQATGVRFPDHDQYRFHMSVAYRLIELTEDERMALDAEAERWDRYLQSNFGILALPTPRLSFFDDMFAFLPVREYHLLSTRKGKLID